MVDLRVKQWNGAGGVNGKKVRIEWRDGECSAKKAKEEEKELINKHNVSIIFGGLCSEETIGASEITNINKVILFTPISSASEISLLGDYVFRGSISNSRQARTIHSLAKQKLYRKVGVFIENRAYSDDLLRIFQDSYEGEVVVSEINLENIPSSINTIKEANVDAILVIVGTPRLLRALFTEIENQEFVNMDFIFDKVALSLDVLAEEFFTLLSKNNAMGAAYILPTNTPRFLRFKQEFYEEYNRDLGYYEDAIAGLDGIDVLLSSLDQVENVDDSHELRNLLLQTQIPGFFNGIFFDENGDLEANYSLVSFDGEKFIKIK